MKITRSQLLQLIAEDGHYDINPDSEAGGQIAQVKRDALEKLKGEIDDAIQDGEGVEDQGEVEEKIKAAGFENPGEVIEDLGLIQTQSGGYTSKRELGPEGEAAIAEGTMKLTDKKIKQLILEEMAEIILAPNNTDHGGHQVGHPDSMSFVDFTGRPDREGAMAERQLRRTAELSHSLADRLHGHDLLQLPSWVQSKITKAADYIDKVYNYLDDDLDHALSEGKKRKKKKASHKDPVYPYFLWNRQET